MAASDVVDEDTMEAVRALWVQPQPTPPPAAPGQPDPPRPLAALFPQPVQAGKLKSPQAPPYATVACEQGPRPNERFARAGQLPVRFDYRKVTLTLWGTKAQVTAGLRAVQALFNVKLGTANNPTLTMPGGARFVRWWPLGDGKLAEADQTKDGTDVWTGEWVGEVWTVREDT